MSDDGRSVLDETVDDAPPTLTVYSYSERSVSTGTDSGFNGTGTQTIAMNSPGPYSDQYDTMNCAPADQVRCTTGVLPRS